MPGEPTWFDVSELICIEINKPGEEVKSNIIDQGEDFYLKATFKGDPAETEWFNMKNQPCKYKARFYGAAMGPLAPGDLNLGETVGDLTLAQNTYEVKSPVNSFYKEGVWRCGVVITFTHQTPKAYYGVLGFNEDCLLQISAFEEPY